MSEIPANEKLEQDFIADFVKSLIEGWKKSQASNAALFTNCLDCVDHGGCSGESQNRTGCGMFRKKGVVS